MDNSECHTLENPNPKQNEQKEKMIQLEIDLNQKLSSNGSMVGEISRNRMVDQCNGSGDMPEHLMEISEIIGREKMTENVEERNDKERPETLEIQDEGLPFSNYKADVFEENELDSELNQHDATMVNGSGDGCISPSKTNNGIYSELRRISCKDVYPDRQLDAVEVSDEDSSDEEIEESPQNPESGLGSPKARRRQRADSHSLLWTDEDLYSSTMHHLDVFRRSKQFCDLVLQVGGREIHCHRVVVGGGSRFLYKELVQGENEINPLGRISLNQIQPLLAPDAVESLVDYMYTAKLIIPQGQLTSVYRASVKLRVERVMPVCRRHIINSVDVENCVETWRLASDVEDIDLLKVVDEFIEENIEAVTKSNEFLALPRIKMVALPPNQPHDVHPFHVLPRDSALSQLALLWVKNVVMKKGGRYMEELTEQIQRISLDELTNNFSYTSSSSSTTSSPGSSKQQQQATQSTPSAVEENTALKRLSRTSSIDSLSSSDSEESTGCNRCEPEGQWNVIASLQTSDHMIALCCLGDILSSVSLHLPNNMISNANFYASNGSHGNCASSSSSSSQSCASSVGSVSDLSHLSQARCAAGVTSLNGKIYAIGGYNQSECLDSVECYDPSTNRWNMLARMGERRARFTAAVLRDQIYAVGGSTGSRDQVSVERYDPVADKWHHAPPLPTRCSGVAVAVMNDQLFCVGGVQQSTGVAGIKFCHVFDYNSQVWRCIAQLNTGRSFAGVAELNNFLYCVGGTDGWTSLTSVERYDGDKWIRGAPLNIPRRGAGLAKHNGTLFCVGGLDGGSFWSSVEQYSAEADCWNVLPTSMTVPRSNVGVVSLNGLLFAVGGYSGRQFLNSMETLDESGEEWTTHDTHVVAVSASGNNTMLVQTEGDEITSGSERDS